MNKLLITGLIVFGLISVNNFALARTVTVTKNVDTPYNYYDNYQSPMYTADLTRIENCLFGSTYKKDNTLSRLNRIEKRLFNRTYPSMNTAARMNNILANYRNYANYNSNYLSNYYSNSTPVSRVRNRLIGVPTGVTPPIYNSPFGTINGINRSFTSNRGYGYNNTIPMMTGAGIHILP